LPAKHLQHDESTLGLDILLSRAVKESRARRADSMFAINGLLQLALTNVLRSMENHEDIGKVSLQHAQENLQTRLSSEMVTALQIIAERYAQPLDIHTLARAVHLSPKHFARKFKAAVGMPPMEYLRRHRLQQAAQQLASDDSIGHIAARCGFEDAAHFSRVFKAHFGMAPNPYRGHLRSFSGSHNSLSSPR
jgi:AraC-like DNA-binding protein